MQILKMIANIFAVWPSQAMLIGCVMSVFAPSRFPKRKSFKKDVNSVLGTVSHSSYRDLSVYCRLKRLVFTF